MTELIWSRNQDLAINVTREPIQCQNNRADTETKTRIGIQGNDKGNTETEATFGTLGNARSYMKPKKRLGI